ncbi:MAG TPA: hypothetical protein DCS13_07550 [Candidatus Margulisbacteria bacterium]|nr:hypothetical protein [Candidatus Margulisiibacteriota bacterium]
MSPMDQRVPCMLCGSDSHERLCGTSRYDIKVTNVICKMCGLVFINPRQTKESLKSYYDKQYREQYTLVDIDSVEYRAGKRAKAQVFINYVPENGKVLEIGCANGVLLSEIKNLRNDISVFGIEPASNLAQSASENYGFEVFCGMVEDYPRSTVKFDLIILDHVLEHFEDPLQSLGLVRDMLSENGVVYIEVPDIRQPYGDLEYNFFQNAHLYNFSYRTITILFRLAGFDIIADGIQNCICFVLRKGTVFRKEAIDFDKEGEDYKEIVKFLNVYKNRFRINSVEGDSAKKHFAEAVITTEIGLERGMQKMYLEAIKDYALLMVAQKDYGKGLELTSKYFDSLNVNPLEIIKMLMLGCKLADADSQWSRFGSLLNEIQKALKEEKLEKDNGL